MVEGRKSPNDLVIMEMLSERYGWTPSQIKEQTFNDIIGYLEVIKAKSISEKAKLKRNGTK